MFANSTPSNVLKPKTEMLGSLATLLRESRDLCKITELRDLVQGHDLVYFVPKCVFWGSSISRILGRYAEISRDVPI